MGASSARYITTSDEISFVDKITYSWEGYRSDCYHEKNFWTEAKPRLIMSFLKGNNMIYHPLNYMLFNLLYWTYAMGASSAR
jgi:hypothetical protein